MPIHIQPQITLFKDVSLAKIQWLNKLNKYRTLIDHKLHKIKVDSNPATHQISNLTKKRFELMTTALKSQKNEIQLLLEPFKLENIFQEISVAKVLAERVPSEQHVLSYFNNIFRDWAWSTNENYVSLEILKKVWPSSKTEELIVLGSGAGRLAYDLALNKMATDFKLVDINPLLLSVSQKMWSGESFELTEINEFPLTQDTITKKWALKTPDSDFKSTESKIESETDSEINVTHIWGDAINLPFKAESLTSILTPWFIDIIPEDFFQFAKRLNSRMRDGATWINFGPLGFGSPERGSSYTKEEIEQILDLAGFKIEASEEQFMTYLHSPLSSQKREEKVLAWRAKKIKKMVAPKDFENYPSWVTNTSEAIPLSPEFQNIASQSQLELQILLSIDGRRSITDIVKLMTEHLKLSDSDATTILLTYFSNYFEK